MLYIVYDIKQDDRLNFDLTVKIVALWRLAMKKIWNKLLNYVSKEQSFFLFLYMGFVAYFKNMQQGNLSEMAEAGNHRDLKRLGKIFEGIPGDTLKQAAEDFEKSIDWELFMNRQPCYEILYELQRIMEHYIKSYQDLEEMIEYISTLQFDSILVTPKSVNQLMAALPVNENLSSMADIFCGISGTGLALLKGFNAADRSVHLTGIEERKVYCDISRLRMFCYGLEQPQVIRSDIMREKGEDTYDLVVADLPKGNNESVYADYDDRFLGDQEKIFTEWVAIQQVLNRVNETGKAMMIVTKGALVRQREKSIREILTGRDWLEGVISLPANMYTSTQLGFELLIINKCKPTAYRQKVFFADLSLAECNKKRIDSRVIETIQKEYTLFQELSDYSRVVSLDQIRENEFSWNPYLYIQMKEMEEEKGKTIELGEIAAINRGAQITKEDERMLAENATHYWLNIRNIEDGGICFEGASMIHAKMPDWEAKFGIQPEDIILTSKGATLKICMVEKDMPSAFLCGNLTRIRVDKEKYSPYVLYEFLQSKKGRAALECIQSGTTIKVFNNTNLNKLSVPNYKNSVETGEQLREVYEEYRRREKEIRSHFETQRKQLLGQLLS